MEIAYDKKTDALSIVLAEGSYEKSHKISDSIIVDMAEDNTILSIEILDASRTIKHFDSSQLSSV